MRTTIDNSELTTFPSPLSLSLSLFPSPFDRRRSKRDPGFSSFSFGSWRWIDRDDENDENKDQKTVLLGLPGRPTTAVGEVRKTKIEKRKKELQVHLFVTKRCPLSFSFSFSFSSLVSLRGFFLSFRMFAHETFPRRFITQTNDNDIVGRRKFATRTEAPDYG